MTSAPHPFLNKQVPRYTSYPTAPHFRDRLSTDDYKTALGQLGEDTTLSLYIHVPYCNQLCWYCGCNTKITNRYRPIEVYMAALEQEIQLVSRCLKAKSVSSIHFGGGSPSILKPDSFDMVMSRLRKAFDVKKDAEIGIELDPRQVTEAKVAAYAMAGVTKASLGVQDFSKDVQIAINRYQPFHTVYQTMKLLRDYGIPSINLDLLYGLPKQTVQHSLHNAELAATLGASRVALFGYAHVPWFKKHMRLIDETSLPNTDQRLAQYHAAREALVEKGYKQIGFDHFAQRSDPMYLALQQKKLRRNFQGYTTDTADVLIGLGPSSISTLPSLYYQNSTDIRSYQTSVSSGELPIEKSKQLSPEDRFRRDIIEQLMCYFEVDLKDACEQHGFAESSLESSIEKLQPLRRASLVKVEGSHIMLTANDKQLIRAVAACFDTYFAPAEQQHAKVA